MNNDSPLIKYVTSTCFMLSYIFAYQSGGLWASYANGMLTLPVLAFLVMIFVVTGAYVVGDEVIGKSGQSVRSEVIQKAREYKVITNVWAFVLLTVPLTVFLLKTMIEGGYVYGLICFGISLIMRYIIVPTIYHSIIEKEESRSDSDDDYDFEEDEDEEE